MEINCGSSNFLAFASRMILFCLVAAVGPMCHETAAQAVTNVTNPRQMLSSPVWNEVEKAVYFIEGGSPRTLIKYDPATKSDKSVEIDATSTSKFLVPLISDNTTRKWAIGFGNVVSVYEWDGATSEKLSSVNSLINVFTDENEAIECGKCDAKNRLWVGTSYMVNDSSGGVAALGKLSSVDVAGNVTKKLELVNIPGGIEWDAGSEKIYYSDIKEMTIIANTFDLKMGNIGSVNDSQTIFDFKQNKVDGIPAGMTLDATGNLWVACRQTNKVLQINPNTGKLVKTFDIPQVSSVTDVAFGGDSLGDLYVTTEANTAMADTPNSGSLFIIPGTGFNGILPSEYNAKLATPEVPIKPAT